MGQLFVVSAPSGAGKTTLCRRLLETAANLSYSVSYTTRVPRQGEVDGEDYFFVTKERFREMIDDGDFLEWAEVFDRYYGTGRQWVMKQLEEGRDILVDIDIAGARQIKKNFPGAAFIFIVPPSIRELRRRLESRRTDSEEQLQIRLNRVREEIEAGKLYDYLIINDDLEKAVEDLKALVRSEQLRFNRARDFWPTFFGEE